MKLGLLTLTIAQSWDLDTIIEKLPALGFEGVEFRTDRQHAHGVETDVADDKLVAVREKFEAAGVEIAGLSSSCSYDTPDPDALRQSIEATKRHLDMCVLLGTGGVKVFGNLFHDDVPHEVTIAQITDSLAECADYGAKVGAKARFEMHGCFEAPEDALQVLSKSDPAGIGLIWNCNPADLTGDSIEANWNAVRDRVDHVHLHEVTEPAYPYTELAGLLLRDGYDGWCTAEIQDSTDADRLLGYYSALWKADLALAKC